MKHTTTQLHTVFLVIVLIFSSFVVCFAQNDSIPFRTVLCREGDFYETKYFRIPAIITTKNGNLVATFDGRKKSNADLPNDISILIRRSFDNGRTWTKLDYLQIGVKDYGFGDCALVRTLDSCGLLAIFAGGKGLWQSTPEEPIRIYYRRSTTDGKYWSQAFDITHFLYGKDCEDSVRRNWRAAFCASGNGLLTSTGRIMFVAAVREDESYTLNNYVLYSDNNGETWQCSQRACIGGDEAKVVELRDGRIVMSIRHNGKRLFNISEDGGITWLDAAQEWNDIETTPCNGDIIRYDRNDGTSILLHSIPLDNERKNVGVIISYDDGRTWTKGKVIVPYSAAYSSLCILNDGTIGLYVEEDISGSGHYEMVFYNFALEWVENN